MEDKQGSTQKIFNEVSYFLACNCSEEVKQYLKLAGATKEFYISDLVTHVLSDTSEFALAEEAKEYNIPVVTQNWVRMSIKAHQKLPTLPFSPRHQHLFSNVRVCPSKIPCDDVDKLLAMVTFYGGKCQLNLTPSCTHLVIPKAVGEKYKVASKCNGKIKIVTPSWVVDCIKENKLLNEENYLPAKGEQLIREPVQEKRLEPEQENYKNTSKKSFAIETSTPMHSEKSVTMETVVTKETPMQAAVTVKTPVTITTVPSEKSVTMETPVIMEVAVTIKTPVTITMSKQQPKEKGSVSKEDVQVKETPARTQGETSNVDKPLEDMPTTRHEECSNKGTVVAIPDGRSQCVIDQDKANTTATNANTTECGQYNQKESSLLAGCVFVVSDYQERMEHSILNTWIEVIRSHGGEVRTFYSPNCTHLLCINQSGKLFCQVLQDGNKVVTADWLNDVLIERKMIPPTKALHFPVPFTSKIPQCENMRIAVTGYANAERLAVKNMIYIIGATYTGYLNRSNTQIICKFSEGTKYMKAKEWGIPCVNAKWLADILSTGRVFPCALKRYSEFGKDNDLAFDELLVKDLLEPWKNELVETNNLDSEDCVGLKRKKGDDKEIQSHAKRPRLSDSITVEVNSNTPHVLITGLTVSKATILMKMVVELGGVPASSPRTCTHLVATKIIRTSKFLAAISVCQFIVTPDWLEKSHESKKFLDPNLFALQDLATEKEYNMSLLTSLKRAQTKPLLKDVKVYATMNVQPSPSSLKEIVEAAGGEFITENISLSLLQSLRKQTTNEGNPAVILVTCDKDIPICTPLIRYGIAVYNAEILLAGVLTQKLDFESYKVNLV